MNSIQTLRDDLDYILEASKEWQPEEYDTRWNLNQDRAIEKIIQLLIKKYELKF